MLGPVPLALDFDYRAALAMEKDAKGEGKAYGRLYYADITGLDVEHEFSDISRRFVRKDLYHGDTNLFDWSFQPNQKRLLFYLLSLMSRARLRRTRQYRAVNSDLYSEE